MKPQNIFLIRHGQSEGNLVKSTYLSKPDYAFELTAKGRHQAREAGKQLLKQIAGSAQIYCSPYWRTRQTFQEAASVLEENGITYTYYEDPRLREQEWGSSFNKQNDNLDYERDRYGHFYYRIKDGESCADVFDRVSDFMNTLHRDFEKPFYPENVIIFTHGMTMRLFLMRWFHWSVEEFERVANPENCKIIHLKREKDSEHFSLKTKLRHYEKSKHPYQFDWNKK